MEKLQEIGGEIEKIKKDIRNHLSSSKSPIED